MIETLGAGKWVYGVMFPYYRKVHKIILIMYMRNQH